MDILKKNDEIELLIEDFSSEGDGIGHYGASNYTLFVKDTVIGDRILVRVMKTKKNYGYARMIKLLEPSPDRVKPVCPNARQCGGCQLQHVSYACQLAFKENKIKSCLQRIGGFGEDILSRMEPILGMENPYFYRNKAQFPVGRDKDGRVVLGFYARHSHQIIGSERCYLQGIEIKKKGKSAEKKEWDGGISQTNKVREKEGVIKGAECRKDAECKITDEYAGKASAADGAGEPSEEAGGENNFTTQNTFMREQSGEKTVEEKWLNTNEQIMSIVCDFLEKYNISVYDEQTHKGLVRHVLTRAGFHTGEQMVCLILNGKKLPYADKLVEVLSKVDGMKSISLNVNTERTNVILGSEGEVLWGEPYITDYIGDIRFQISPQSFFQVNPVQTERLYQTALDYAGLTGNETVWDLYCGIGTISLFLAQKAKRVYGVEIVPKAIEDAKRNAALNHITNAEFFVGAAEKVVPRKLAEWGEEGRVDVVVVDPPRKGCDAVLLDAILKTAPNRVVYVSCDPATLARDLKILCEGGYEIKRWRGCDMFGQSGHVECVTLLQRKDI